jgi:hypothetical protein
VFSRDILWHHFFLFFVLYDEIYLLTNSFASGCGVNQFFGRPVREAFYDAVELI